MTDVIPRTLVATVLGVAPEALPPGDLPVARLAARFLDFLSESFLQEADAPHPEAWTFALYGGLIADHAELALATLLEMTTQITRFDEADLIASGPLDELLNAKSAAALLPLIEAAAQKYPRFAFLLSGASAEGSAGTPFWKAIRALGETAAEPDDLEG
ncbi:DUF6869 domain-containing protein [Falsigemmobacter faecalis]|uniref:DUF6869 domain-containing protein n=1 Tax=Falsigemmobacter faecalis TaxID=2488730 RepID=A0A3P3DN93_9RHOB|nr:hypothetical protein [Falsigemmobacter faecalis]RRH75146.1 hypothetical protein EG244_09175 [Falsigemmobacter faecalis]